MWDDRHGGVHSWSCRGDRSRTSWSIDCNMQWVRFYPPKEIILTLNHHNLDLLPFKSYFWVFAAACCCLTSALWVTVCLWRTWSCSGPPGVSAPRCWLHQWLWWCRPGPGCLPLPCWQELSGGGGTITSHLEQKQRSLEVCGSLCIWQGCVWIKTIKSFDACQEKCNIFISIKVVCLECLKCMPAC